MIVASMPKRGVQVEHDVTLANMEMGSVVIMGSIVEGPNRYVYTNSNGDDVTPTNPFESYPSNSGSNAGFLTGYVGTSTTNAQDPQLLDSWFSAATYIGAVPESDDWTEGWTKSL